MTIFSSLDGMYEGNEKMNGNKVKRHHHHYRFLEGGFFSHKKGRTAHESRLV